MPKAYLAEFENSRPPFDVFQKIGHTGHNDAQKRLDWITSEYPHYKARVLAAVYHHDIEFCKGVEEAFKVMYPKNFWLEEKISGVTEIVKLNSDDRIKVIQQFRTLNEKTKKELFSENRT